MRLTTSHHKNSGSPTNYMTNAMRAAGSTDHRSHSTSIATHAAACSSSSPIASATSGAGNLA